MPDSIFWISYALLWAAMLVTAVLLVGALREVAELGVHIRTARGVAEFEGPNIEEDGPRIGEPLPQLERHTPANGHSINEGSDGVSCTLLIFVSHTCLTCQRLVAPLNSLASKGGSRLRVRMFIKADQEGCEAFLSVYEVAAPVFCDGVRGDLARTLGVHRFPMGLLYGPSGHLVRKGTLADGQVDLDILLGDGEPSTLPAHMHS